MVRRVGFSNPDKEEDGVERAPSLRYWQRKRRGKTTSAAPDSPALADRIQKPLIPRNDTPKGKKRAKWIILAFLTVWLVGWSFGIYSAITSALASSGFSLLFLIVWICAAAFGWVVVAFIIIALLFGKEIKRPKRAK